MWYTQFLRCPMLSSKLYNIIQNQFFISYLPDDEIKNKFAEALRERISRAHAQNRKFRVIIMMPLFPNFEGTYNIYRIAGHFSEVFNLATWRIFQRSPNLKSLI